MRDSPVIIIPRAAQTAADSRAWDACYCFLSYSRHIHTGKKFMSANKQNSSALARVRSFSHSLYLSLCDHYTRVAPAATLASNINLVRTEAAKHSTYTPKSSSKSPTTTGAPMHERQTIKINHFRDGREVMEERNRAALPLLLRDRQARIHATVRFA